MLARYLLYILVTYLVDTTLAIARAKSRICEFCSFACKNQRQHQGTEALVSSPGTSFAQQTKNPANRVEGAENYALGYRVFTQPELAFDHSY